jgi:hypothetical protein
MSLKRQSLSGLLNLSHILNIMRCRNALPIAVILVLASIAHAVVLTSGDGGSAFATDTSFQKCADPNVMAVYVCSGNVVQVVSSAPGEGSTFYKPDGQVVYCPDVSPSEMGAECVQLFSPNLCPPVNVCPPPVVSVSNGEVPVAPKPPVKSETTANPPKPASNESVTIIPLAGTGVSDRDVYVLAIVILGMVIIAFFNYKYLSKKGSELE